MVINIETKDLLSVSQVAKILKKPKLTIYRWITAKKLTAIKLGGIIFVPTSEVERLKQREQRKGQRYGKNQ